MNVSSRICAGRLRPAGELDIAQRLGLNKKQRASLSQEIRLLLSAGQVVRAAGGKIALASAPAAPVERKEVIGKIQFRAGGSAFVIPDSAGRASALPRPADRLRGHGAGTAGDQVAVRILEGVRTRRPGETAGRVLRVIERGRDTVVGNLTRTGRMFTVVADDPRFVYPVAVPDPAKAGLPEAPQLGDKVVVRLGEWKQRHLPRHRPGRRAAGPHPRAPGGAPRPLREIQPRDRVPRPRSNARAAALPDRVPAKDAVAGSTTGPSRSSPSTRTTRRTSTTRSRSSTSTRATSRSGSTSPTSPPTSGPARPSTREAQRRGNSTYLVGTVIRCCPTSSPTACARWSRPRTACARRSS